MVVIFDLVGTLFSLDRVREVFTRLLRANAVEFDLWFEDLLKTGIGATLAGHAVSYNDLSETTLRRLLVATDRPDADPAPILEAFKQIEPWDDAMDCLKQLTDNGHRLVVLSNASRDDACAIIERAGLGPYFSEVLAAEDYGRLKPHPIPYLRALQWADTAPESTTHVTAHSWDVLGADALGMNTIWVSRLERAWPLPGPRPRHCTFVDTLAEVPAAIG